VLRSEDKNLITSGGNVPDFYQNADKNKIQNLKKEHWTTFAEVGSNALEEAVDQVVLNCR